MEKQQLLFPLNTPVKIVQVAEKQSKNPYQLEPIFVVVDVNAARNILRIGLSTAGHTGTFGLEPISALGELTSTLIESVLSGQVDSLNKESPVTSLGD